MMKNPQRTLCTPAVFHLLFRRNLTQFDANLGKSMPEWMIQKLKTPAPVGAPSFLKRALVGWGDEE